MLLKAEEIKALKARIKEQCLRRCHKDSVAAYGGTTYDYTDVPASGVKVKQEHYDKIATPLNAINADKVPNKTAGTDKKVSRADYTAMEGFVTQLEQRDQYDRTGSDCKGNCAGLCFSSCTGSCSNGCSGGCLNTCTGNCTGGCGGACSNDCSGCSGCGDACSSGCGGSCSTNCSGCSGCGGQCSRNCTGCSGNCVGTCSTTCTGSCIDICRQMCSENCDTDAML